MFLVLGTASARAEGDVEAKFTGHDLLAMGSEQQSAWVGASVLTVAHMLTRDERTGPAATCVLEWYFGEGDEAQAQIFGHIRQNPDHYPTTIIFAMIDRACGGLNQPVRERS